MTMMISMMKKQPIRLPQLKHEWILVLSFIPQLALFFVPNVAARISEEIIPFLLIFSLLGMLVFTGFNLSVPGFIFLALGLISNFLAISTNRGWMPISPQTLKQLHPELPITHWSIGARLSYSKDMILQPENTNLHFLSDIIPVPAWINYKFAFSIGDIFIGLGVIVLIWSISTKLKERK